MANEFTDIIRLQTAREKQATQPLSTQPVETNEYDATVQSISQGNQRTLEKGQELSRKVAPDQAARIEEIHQRTRLPRDIVADNLDSMDKKYRHDEGTYQSITTQSPALADWLREDINGSIADDDLPQMGAIEWMMTAPKQALSSGRAQVEFGYLAYDSMFGPQDAITLGRMRDLRGEMNKMQGALGAENWFSEALVYSANQLPMLYTPFVESAKVAPAALATVLNPAAGSQFLRATIESGQLSRAGGFIFMQESGHAYNEFIEVQDELGNKIDPGVARMAALASGSINAGLEFTQLGIIVKAIPGVRQLIARGMVRKAIKDALRKPAVRTALLQAGKDFGVTVGQEASIEAAQRAVTVLARELAKSAEGIETIKASEFFGEVSSEFGHALQAFAPIMLPGPMISAPIQIHQIKQAQRTQQYFEALGGLAQESKTIQRAPAKAQEFIERATADGPIKDVYIDPARWETYYQDLGLPPEQMAREIGLESEYTEALTTQRDMVIPISVYATRVAPNQQNTGLVPDLRLDPSQPTPREVQDAIAGIEQTGGEVEQLARADQQREQQVQQLREQVKTELLEGGKFDQKTAEVLADLQAQFATVTEQRSGVSLADAFKRMTVTRTGIEGKQQQEGEQVLEQAQVPTESVPVGEMNAQTKQRVKARTKQTVRKMVEEKQISPESSFRGTSIDELKQIARSRRLSVGSDAEGRPGISAALIGEEAQFPVYNDGVGYIVPPDSTEASGRAGETLVDEKLDPTTLQYVIGDRVMTFDEMVEALSAEETARIEPLTGKVFYQSPAVETKAFKDWFGESKIVDENGDPLVVYHGTTADFDAFDPNRAQTESDWGAGFYFSNNTADIEFNYAGIGHDLQNKIDQQAELIASETDREYDDPAVVAEAREAFMQHEGFTMPVYLAIENPAIIGGENETRLEYEVIEDEETGDFVDEQGTLVDFIVNLRNVAERYESGSVEELIDSLLDVGDGITVARVYEIAKETAEFSYFEDFDTGKMVSSEIVRQALERTGFDGIIDNEVDVKFGSQRRIGKAMEGMTPDTVHYIAFQPEQIKSAIGNETFDPTNPNILEQQGRGRIRVSPDQHFRIELLENADLSTFVHESGHMWLEMMGDVVEQLRAGDGQLTVSQRQMLADYDTLLDWFGVDERGKIKTKHHEQLARGIEAYFWEGKAPSEKLRAIMARITAWMKSIYRSLTQLNVSLTPEVRGVFDRMLASDAEIEAIEAQQGVDALFVTTDMAQQAGLSREFVEAYRKQVQKASDTAKEQYREKALEAIRREHTAWWGEEKDKIRPQVEAELAEQPVYIAQAVLKDGTMPDGTPAEVGPMKLNRRALGPDEHKSLPKGVTTRETGGITPDQAAELFGFASGRDLLEALKAAVPFAQAVENAVETRLRQIHGDPALTGELAEQAQLAVQNDARAQVIEMELRALSKAQRAAAPAVRLEQRRAAEARREARGGVAALRAGIPTLKAVRAAARDRIARMRVIDVKPHLYLSAARRHGKAAILAAAQQDFDTALNEKSAEMLHVELFRAAQDARNDADRIRKYARSFDEGKKRGRIGRAGQDYLDQIDAIRANYEFAKISAKAVERRVSLRQWIEQKEADGQTVQLPDSVVDARQVNYRELSMFELRGVEDALKHIEHLSQLKNRLLTQKEQRDLNEAAETLADNIREHGGKKKTVGVETRLPEDKVARAADAWFGSHRKLSSYIREMDGFVDNGPAFELLLNPINHAADSETTLKAEAGEKWREILGVYEGKEMRQLYDKEFIPALGTSLTKMARLMVALNMGNATNKARIMENERGGGYGWTQEQVDAILDGLDERDWKFVQDTWDFINSYRGQIAEKERRVNGIEPVWVEPTPVVTKYGTFAGGYFPLKYDANQNDRVGQMEIKEQAKMMMQGGYTRSTTRRGHLEVRRENVELPVRLDFGVISEHINQVIHDVTHHEMLLDVNRLLTKPNVVSAIKDHYGMETLRRMRKVIEDTAAGPVFAQKGWESFINHIRTGTSVAFLGWNLFTGLLQPLGLAQSMTRIGPGWVLKGTYKWMSDATHLENSAAWIREKSQFMTARQDTQMREINEIMNRFGTDTGKLKGWIDQALDVATFGAVNRAAIADGYFWLIYKGQQIADIPTWLGAYEKAMATMPDITEDRAIDLADQAVRDSQGSGHIHDQAAIQRGNALLKLWTNFYSYFNVTYNRLVESGKIAKRQGGMTGAGRLAVDYFLLMLVPSIMGALGRMALKGELDDADQEDIMMELGNELVMYHAGMMIGLREFSAGFQALTESALGAPARRQVTYAGPAGVRFFEAANRTMGQMAQGEVDEAFLKAANEAAGIMFHYPAGQVNRTLRGYAALMEGETENPLVLIGGPPRKKP